MTLAQRIARWLDPEAALAARKHWYLTNKLRETETWLAVDFPAVAAAIRFVGVSEQTHFAPLNDPNLRDAVPGKPWINTIGDLREHMRSTYLTPEN